MNLKTTAAIALFSFLPACSPMAPLGDGRLSGNLPTDWTDSVLTSAGMVLRVTDDTVPLPAELVITEPDSGSRPCDPSEWVMEREETRPAPRTRVGDQWQENQRTVRIYRKCFEGGRILEAAADIRFERSRIERFLSGLRATTG